MNWSSVAAQLSGASFTNGVWYGPNWLAASDRGFFGVSTIGYGFAPDPSLGQPPFPLFGGPGTQGVSISSGFDLFVINTPEPPALPLLVVGAAAVIVLWRGIKRGKS
jgi:hypothetical protein